MWEYSGLMDPGQVSPEAVSDDEVSSWLEMVLKVGNQQVVGGPPAFDKGHSPHSSRPHLPKGAEGAAKKATQVEASWARKEKKARKAERMFKKEQEIAHRVRMGEDHDVCPDVNRPLRQCWASGMEAQPGATCFDPRKGLGYGLCGRAIDDDSDSHMTRCRVTVSVPPPSSAGRREEIVAPVSKGGGALGSPARLELEENDGATLVLADMETKARLLTETEEALTRGVEHLD
ncbi:hypothetical protein C2845_PM06G26840 [Panicum miliaceum]|uniref:Uncharacterized protein n=1 Tax=Panicum miliaceum TaxID=4540 RepID=A0A3L6R7P8_PANMI|nr:hypothetical protein C2845_PM06G26840 [Panicum miliaceum]